MFDILMEGELDEETGDYKVLFKEDEEDELPPKDETMTHTKGSSFKKPKMTMAEVVQETMKKKKIED
jgi:hypothetical protein|tara:strand:+ start:203 stop:403 length:201 start_codon:yes stop_codon:yes gene_type:complete